MDIINFENLTGIPKTFLNRFFENRNIFTEFDFLEDIEDNLVIQSLIVEINKYCSENTIIGFHFTRVIVEDILKKGLLVRTGSEIRNEFLDNYSYRC